MLNDDQLDAKKAIMARLEMGARHVALQGHAGSGKTYLAADLCRTLTAQGHTVHACAPTHKAAYVLGEKMPIETQTIHSLLGLKVVPDYNGGHKLVKRSRGETPEPGIVLLDESSMVGSQLWKHIEDTPELQWVFIGDPAQLPPVNQKPSPALNAPGARLTGIVRQEKGNPILDLATRVRKSKPLGPIEYSNGQGVGKTRDRDSFTESALKAFDGHTDSTPPPSRILAYRNRVVGYYNDCIRRYLLGSGGSVPRFATGDWITLKDTYFEAETAIARNSEEVCVAKVSTDQKISVGGTWKVWQLQTKRSDGTQALLPVLHESEKERWERLRAQVKSEAIALKKRGKQKRGNQRWKDWYSLEEAFAWVDYCYAMTVHRSQGSTFETVYVDLRDVQNCQGGIEQELTYVACTRPSKRLALLTN